METIIAYLPGILAEFDEPKYDVMYGEEKECTAVYREGYFFTPEELSDLKQRVAGEAYDAGARNVWKRVSTDMIDEVCPDKTEYLKSLKQ
jgi:hypothetical protein